MAFIQAANAASNGVTSLSTANFASSVTTNNAIFVAVTWDDGTPLTVTVSDTQSNVYTSAAAKKVDANSQAIQLFYKLGATGGAAFHPTATFTGGTANFVRILAHEASGVATSAGFDQHQEGSDVSAAPATVAVTTTTAGQYIFAAVMNSGTAANTYSASGSYTEPANSTASAAANEMQAEYQVQSSAGSIQATWTRSASGANVYAMATFKAAGAAAASLVPIDQAAFVPFLVR